jgi:alkylation response protein AidB-like acyl-CoA dehydrogenase
MTEYSSDLAQFRRQVRDQLVSLDVPSVAEDLDPRFVDLRAWQRTLYETGLIGLTWPKEWGGSGMTYAHQQVLNTELVRARAPQPIGLIGLDVVGRSIGNFGSAQQRAELLPALLSGERPVR